MSDLWPSACVRDRAAGSMLKQRCLDTIEKVSWTCQMEWRACWSPIFGRLVAPVCRACVTAFAGGMPAKWLRCDVAVTCDQVTVTSFSSRSFLLLPGCSVQSKVASLCHQLSVPETPLHWCAIQVASCTGDASVAYKGRNFQCCAMEHRANRYGDLSRPQIPGKP